MGRFRPNRQLRSQLARQAEHKQMLRENAERVKDAAERNSPIGDRQDYIHAFRIVEYPTMVRVGNADFAAHWVEWGSINNPPYAPLRTGVIAAGLRLAEDMLGGDDAADSPA